MDIRDLRWLLALAERGKVTETAAALAVSQPTLTRAVQRLEAELGVRLFERSPDGVHVTELGLLAVDAARDIVARHEQLVREIAHRINPDSGLVRLAFLDSLATSLVPALLRDFHRDAPHVSIALSQAPSHVIEAELRGGRADVAITSAPPSGTFGWHLLHEDRLVVVVPPTHRFSHRQRIALSELDGEDVVATPTRSAFREVVERMFAEAGVVPNVTFESAELATIEGLVSAGLGVAVLPEPMGGLTGSHVIPLSTSSARRNIGLTWRTDVDLTPVAQRFRSYVLARN